MSEFWEEVFRNKQEMWGREPARSAILIKDLFVEHNVKNMLISEIGYGRNGQIFIDHGMEP